MGSGLYLSPSFCIYLAVALLLMPLPWLIAIVVAAAVHELFHILAIRLVGGSVASARLYLQGASIPLPEMGRGQELLCALAGPLGSFLLMGLASYIPRIAICGALQGMYNLLPLYPLDGGRAWGCFLSMLFSPPLARKIQTVTEMIVFCGLLLLGIYGTFMLKLGFFPLVMVILLFIRKNSGKIPCKLHAFRVK